MAFVTANTLNMYYEIHGEGPETLLLLAGLTRDSRIWQWILPELSKHFRVVCVDNRCAGQSDKPDEAFTIADMAEDVYQFLQAVGIKKAHVLGHSMGGFIAQQLALMYPEVIDGLMLASTAKALDDPSAQVYLKERIDFIRSGKEVKPEDAVHLFRWLYAGCFCEDDHKMMALQAWEAGNPHPQPREATLRQAEACLHFNVSTQVEQIKHKLLFLHGEEDRLFPIAQTHALAARLHAQCMVFQHVGHMLPIECPPDFRTFYKG